MSLFLCKGLLDKLNGLNAWYKVIVLRLTLCELGVGGARAIAEALRVNSTVTSLDLGTNRLGEGGGRALRMNSTVSSLNLSNSSLGEGGGRAIAEILRVNSTVSSLNLS